ncbi:hypothetical protein BGX30_009690, partial [Mortierella sp. GBA39]
FVGAGLTAALIYSLSYTRNKGIRPIRLMLTGIAVAAGIQAAMIVLTLRLKPEQYQFMGEQMATSLGENVRKEQFRLLAAAVALAAASVAVSGGIAFVGLVGPHLARRLVGPKHQMLLPVSALIGALLVIAADTIGRWILQPSGVPTGIVVAVIGAPYFLYLLARAKS